MRTQPKRSRHLHHQQYYLRQPCSSSPPSTRHSRYSSAHLSVKAALVYTLRHHTLSSEMPTVLHTPCHPSWNLRRNAGHKGTSQMPLLCSLHVAGACTSQHSAVRQCTGRSDRPAAAPKASSSHSHCKCVFFPPPSPGSDMHRPQSICPSKNPHRWRTHRSQAEAPRQTQTGQSVLTYFTRVELQGEHRAHYRVHAADGTPLNPLSMLSSLGSVALQA